MPVTELSVLIIDDMLVVRKVIARALTRIGYSVTQAASGQEAVTRLLEAPGAVDAILLDMQMPGTICEELLTRLREVAPKASIILMSGLGEGIPGEMFLAKPFTVAALCNALDTLALASFEL